MNTMTLIDIDTPSGGSYVELNGDFGFNQRSPISPGAITSKLYYKDMFVNATSPIDFMTLYKEYVSRNITTPLKIKSRNVMPLMSTTETVLDITLEIPYHDIK
jgi:hypothetical protein